MGFYVKIAKSLEYCRAVKDKKLIEPRIYQETNGQARHIISSMNNMIPGMTLGIFVIKPIPCRLTYIKDQVTKDKCQPDKNSWSIQPSTTQVAPKVGAAMMAAFLLVIIPVPIPALLALCLTCQQLGSLL